MITLATWLSPFAISYQFVLGSGIKQLFSAHIYFIALIQTLSNTLYIIYHIFYETIRLPRISFSSSSLTVMKTDMYSGTAMRRGMSPLNRLRTPSSLANFII